MKSFCMVRRYIFLAAPLLFGIGVNATVRGAGNGGFRGTDQHGRSLSGWKNLYFDIGICSINEQLCICDNGQSSSSIFNCGCPDCSTAKAPHEVDFCKRKEANAGNCARGQSGQSGNGNSDPGLQGGGSFQSDRHTFVPGGSFWQRVKYGGVLGVMSALFLVVILTSAYMVAGLCMHCAHKKRPTVTREMLEGEQDLEGPGKPVRGAVARRIAGTNVIPLDIRGSPQFIRIQSLSRVFPLDRVESNASSTSATVLQEDEESIATTNSATSEMSRITPGSSTAYLEMEASPDDTSSVNTAMLAALRLRTLTRNNNSLKGDKPIPEDIEEYVSMEGGANCSSNLDTPALQESGTATFELMQDSAVKIRSMISSATERNRQKLAISKF